MTPKTSLRLAAFFGLFAATAVGPSPRAQAIPNKHPNSVSRAIQVYLTPRGQKYFDNHLIELISRHGYELGEGGFEQTEYKAQEPIFLNDLPIPMKPYAETLGQLRDLVARWFRNAKFGDPLIDATLKDIHYAAPTNAQGAHFGIQIDADTTHRLMKNKGVALTFQAVIPEVEVDAGSVRAHDLNNMFLGDFGADRPILSLELNSQPLVVTIPVSLKLDPQGGIVFEIRDIQTNLPSTQMFLGLVTSKDLLYRPEEHQFNSSSKDDPFVLPYLGARINGVRVPLNKVKLETELDAQVPALLKAAQQYLAGFASERAPSLLNSMIAEKFSNSLFSDINEMDPPGIDGDPQPEDRYRWGITPEELSLTPGGFLKLGFSGFIEDPRAKDPNAVVSKNKIGQQAPDVDEFLDPSTYDAALTINQDLVNRVIGLSYQRGYKSIRQLEIAGSKPLEVLEPPAFRFDFPGDQGKLHVKVRHFVEGLPEEIAMSGQVTFQMDVNAHLVHTADGQLSVEVNGVDVDSLSMYTYSVHKIFRGIVFGKLLKKLRATNQDLHDHPKVVVESLPIPDQVGGIPLKVKNFRADPNGYLVLYTEYDFTR